MSAGSGYSSTVFEDAACELSAQECSLLALYGLDDYICCYDDTFFDKDELWRAFVIQGAKALADDLDSPTCCGEGYLLRGEQVLFAFEALVGMQHDSPLDELPLESRERANALVERLRVVAAPAHRYHWEWIYDEQQAEKAREREIAEGSFREVASKLPRRLSPLA